MTQALYRRYRPESFADVIGQEHVTAPLLAALGAGKVNHAYLFSGPRGCGKTTSARILARCLNCAQGPTPTPCGTCPSCVELARGGSGSLDVVEIDAASHGGVDDARELRERATIGPARDRFKVYIIDEAHMVTPAGFNALLKLVEEPPDYVKFVFATTEPDKVLQTIRSRTHHYSFRLVPPDTLSSYLEQLCSDEGVTVAKGVLPLVVRAGAGSVRDSLSVLDQLIAGSGPEGVDYPLAVSLLGYTDAALLDEVVSALGQADGAALFGVVDRVVQSGHDPRQFVTDLLERLRDLIVLQAMGEAAHGVLRAVPQDQLDRMRTQSTYLGAGELSRAADVVNAALTEMVGASSPRMHLELLCARLLLPSADAGESGLGARLDRIERRLGARAPAAAAPTPVRTTPAAATPAATTPAPTPPAPAAAPARAEQQPAAEPPAAEQPAAEPPAVERPAVERPGPERPAARRPAEQSPVAAAEAEPGALDTDAMRRMWPDLLRQVQGMKRSTWMIVSANAQVHELAGGVLRLAFSNQGTARGFGNGQHAEVVAAAVEQLLGVRVRVEAVEGAASAPPARAAAPPASAPPASAPPAARPPAERPQPERTQAQPQHPPPERRTERPQPERRPERPPVPPSGWDGSPPPDEPPPDPDAWEPPPGDPWATAAPARPAPAAAAPAPAAEAPAARPSRVEQMANAARPERAVEDVPSDDDPDLDDVGPAGQSVVEEMLGGSVIDVEQR